MKRIYLESAYDQNTNDPCTPFVNDIFYSSRNGDALTVQEMVAANPKSVNYVDRYGNLNN
jgi:hypothetical protein